MRFRKNSLKASFTVIALLVAVSAFASSAQAELSKGDDAPDFTVDATLGGKGFQFTLSEALKKGPVVLYFYPKAFTSGCTIEAHEFAEATDRYKALGATVLGISDDSIETLSKFSVEECRSKFPVAADKDGDVMKAYDSEMVAVLGLADRVSYVITPDDKIFYVYQASSPEQHVANTLQALEDWRAQKQLAE